MIPVQLLCLLQRLFVVPAYTEAQRNIPFGRVNHNKYMVTDKTAYIGLYKFVCEFIDYNYNWEGNKTVDCSYFK